MARNRGTGVWDCTRGWAEGSAKDQTVKLRYWILALVYCGAIFVLSSKPDVPNLGGSFPGKDKLAHAVLYAGLASVLALGVGRSGRVFRPRLQFWLPLLLPLLYGATDELHQYFVPPRTPDVLDWFADGTGALAAAGFFYLFYRAREPVAAAGDEGEEAA